MITYKYRPLSGNYRGSVNNQFADYLKISNGMLELSVDLPSLDSRISSLESGNLGILTTSDFLPNSINGNIIQDQTLNGSKISPNTITGAMIISNSTLGITDINISPNAQISPSKINIGAISHTQLQNIGHNTHAQIDSQLSQIFGDLGDVPGSGFPVPLTTQVNNLASYANGINASLVSLSNFVDPAPLSTVAQKISPAINELTAGLQAIQGSGFGISGPVTATLGAVALWGNNNRTLTNSSVATDGFGNLYIPENLYFFNSGNPTIGNPTNGVGTLYMNNSIQFKNAASITGANNQPVYITADGNGSLYLQGGDAIAITPSGISISGVTTFVSDIFPKNVGSAINPAGNGYFNTITASNFATSGILQGSEIVLTSGNNTYFTVMQSIPNSQNATVHSSGTLNIIADNSINMTASNNLILDGLNQLELLGGLVSIFGSSNVIINGPTTLFNAPNISAAAPATVLGYTKVNGSNNSSTTLLDQGILIYGNGDNNAFGLDLGFNQTSGRSRIRTFFGGNNDIAFSYVNSPVAPSGQNNFTDYMVLTDTGKLGIGTITPQNMLDVVGKAAATGGVKPGNATNIVNSATIYSGSGAPLGIGATGDFYFRTDTPSTTNQRLYINTGSWTGIL